MAKKLVYAGTCRDYRDEIGYGDRFGPHKDGGWSPHLLNGLGLEDEVLVPQKPAKSLFM